MIFLAIKASHWQQFIRTSRLIFLAIILGPILYGCGLPTMSGLVEGLNQQTDLELVCDGAPSYLLLLDSLLAEDPTDLSLLVNATKAYSAYLMVMTECDRPDRSVGLSEKARNYGLRLLDESSGVKQSDTLDTITEKLRKIGKDKVESLFWGAYGWAKWISYQQGSPAAVIDLPKVEIIMNRIVALDESFYNGGAHTFLGIYHSLKPAIYGGRPDVSRSHFEKALTISGRRFLPIQVAYAQNYAKMVFNRGIYQKLLEEVLQFDLATAPSLTLSNLVAQKQARRLLNTIDDYF